MLAAVIAEPKQTEIEHLALPDPGPGEVRVRLEGSGVCGSNLPAWEGRSWFHYPTEPGSPGHEGWGFIDAIGDGVTGLSVGDRVAALSYRAYAEYDIAQAHAVVPLPQNLAGRFFPGEPLGCAINIFRRSDIEVGQTVVIVGIGFLGAVLTRLASRAGARVIAVSRRPSALATAQAFGAAETIPMEDHWQIIERVKQLTGEAFCDVVVEA